MDNSDTAHLRDLLTEGVFLADTLAATHRDLVGRVDAWISRVAELGGAAPRPREADEIAVLDRTVVETTIEHDGLRWSVALTAGGAVTLEVDDGQGWRDVGPGRWQGGQLVGLLGEPGNAGLRHAVEAALRAALAAEPGGAGD